MVETVNNLLQPQARAAWMGLSTSEQLRAATMLLDTVEQGAFVLADNLLKTDVVQENTENIRKSFTFMHLADDSSYSAFRVCILSVHAFTGNPTYDLAICCLSYRNVSQDSVSLEYHNHTYKWQTYLFFILLERGCFVVCRWRFARKGYKEKSETGFGFYFNL